MPYIQRGKSISFYSPEQFNQRYPEPKPTPGAVLLRQLDATEKLIKTLPADSRARLAPRFAGALMLAEKRDMEAFREAVKTFDTDTPEELTIKGQILKLFGIKQDGDA